MGELIQFRPRQEVQYPTQGALAVVPQQQSLEYDAEQALALNNVFYKALGSDPPSGRLKNYEIGIERAKFDRFRSRTLNDTSLPLATREEALEGFKAEAVKQVTTALGERYHAASTTYAYTMRDGQLYSSLSPEEPMEDVLVRGLFALEKSHSKEQAREQAEFRGWKKIQKIIANKKIPVGTKIIQMSPPGMTEDTAYPKRFVDGWEIKVDADGNRYAVVTRFTTSLDHEGYIAAAEKMNPHFFDAFHAFNKGKPVAEQKKVDEPLLENVPAFHPKWTIEGLYEEFFEKDYEARQEQEFQNLIKVCLPIILHQVDVLCDDKFRPVDLAEGYNAILARGDMFIAENERRGTTRENEAVSQLIAEASALPVNEQVLFWSKQDIRSVAGAGCGNSEPFKIRYGFDSIEELTQNSIVKYGLNKDMVKAECPDCKTMHTKKKDEWIYRCKDCGSRAISCGREEPLAA